MAVICCRHFEHTKRDARGRVAILCNQIAMADETIIQLKKSTNQPLTEADGIATGYNPVSSNSAARFGRLKFDIKKT